MIPICHLSVYSVHPLKSKRIKQNMLGWYQSINMFFLNLASGKFSTYFMFFIYHVSSFVCMFVMLIDLHTIKDFKKAFVFSHTGLKPHSHFQLLERYRHYTFNYVHIYVHCTFSYRGVWTVYVVQVGWFPSNYTQEEIDDPHTYCMAENVLDIMVALYQFKEHCVLFFSVSEARARSS